MFLKESQAIIETLIKVENLNVKYGNTHVIKDLSFEVKDVVRNGHITGQIVAVLGESGCGKSTLFRALSGLKGYTGTIQIADIEGNKFIGLENTKVGHVGLVDQKYTMFRHKTVNQTLVMALRNRKDVTDIQSHIDKYTKQISIDHILDKYPNEISGGQRQRAALLERLFNDNHFIILDEPFSGLDVKSKITSKSFIREIVNENEYNTVMFCTHNIESAVQMADLILILSNDGRLVKQINLRDEEYEYNAYSEKHIQLANELNKFMLNL